MKILKHFIIYVSIFCILTISLFSVNSRKVYAEVPTSQKAIPHSSTWGSYMVGTQSWNYYNYRKYWTIEDPTGIPNNPAFAPYYFYNKGNGTFFIVHGGNLVQTILSGGLNIIYDPDKASAIISAFFDSISGRKDNDRGLLIQGGVYDSQNNLLGYALNDISNCHYEGIIDVQDVKVPSYQTNNVKNFVDAYDKANPVSVDYFTFICPTTSYVLDNWTASTSTYTENVHGNFNDLVLTYDNLHSVDFSYNRNSHSMIGMQTYNTNPSFYGSNQDDYTFIYDSSISSTASWDNFCKAYELINENHELLFTQFIEQVEEGNTNTLCIGYVPYDPENGLKRSWTPYTTSISQYPKITAGTSDTNGKRIGFPVYAYNYNYNIECPVGKNITIYKNWSTYQAINDTKTYEPTTYYGDDYYNYNPSADNGFSVTTTQIDNSVTTNETIFETITDSYYENVSNNTVNTENISNSTQTIINNYYNTGSSDPENPSDPEDPSDPSDPEDEEGIWDAILAALLRFFKAIGKLLGTVLAGLLEVIDALLESIAGIVESFSGVTDFISALFSWIPEPVPQVLGVGLSICILAAIIKFIRG